MESWQGLGGEKKRQDPPQAVGPQPVGGVQLREGFGVKQSEGDLERRGGSTGTLSRLMKCHGKGAGDRGRQ